MTNQTKKENLHAFLLCAYGESPYLETCIQSLKNQTMPGEILIATSTPNDAIFNLAEKYSLPVFVNKGESGIGEDWNFALSCSDKPYLTIAHQDDVYDPHYTERAVNTLLSSKHPLIFFSGYKELRGEKEVGTSLFLIIKKILLLPLRFRCLSSHRICKRLALCFGNPVCCPSVTFCVDNMPQPLFTTSMKSNLDWDAWERLSRLPGSFLYDREPLVCHRIHPDSTTSKILSDNERRKEDLILFRRFWPEPVAKLIEKFYQNSEKNNILS